MLREITLLADAASAEALSDALLEGGALAVSIEDADADTADEQPLYGEPGGHAELAAWSHNRLSVLLRKILAELGQVRYIREVIVTLGPASEEEFSHAKEFFSALPQETNIIWNKGPRFQEIYRTIEHAELPTGEQGKGRSAWMAYGYVLSRHLFHSIALHDCDILNYSRDLLARLCYPVTNPSLDYDFCKGFYSRVSDRLHGRLTRLLVTPLIRALQKIVGYHPLLVFFDSFRYPLAGEFS